MDNSNLEEIKWLKRNFWIRLVLIALLIIIAVIVLYNHFGYLDPDDVGIIVEMSNQKISCKQALYYFAENELGIYNRNDRKQNLDRLNISNWTSYLK